ncbi:hypothetical protein H6P81_010685 [Aristolochia fimbriata]|uniref:Uncharacterized protein n=1 Tax=Aristolochia fimbriata TaxID=158543 RepID=A0AAV7EPG2_ARIFI|nr:hypothetical protein H6P81_010685 [Aristolochia fimbriata]
MEVILDPVLLDKMCLGFSSSTCELPAVHYMLNWSFKMDERAWSLKFSSITFVPKMKSNETSKFLMVGLDHFKLPHVSAMSERHDIGRAVCSKQELFRADLNPSKRGGRKLVLEEEEVEVGGGGSRGWRRRKLELEEEEAGVGGGGSRGRGS